MKVGDIIRSKNLKRIFKVVNNNCCFKCPFSCQYPGNDRDSYCLDIAFEITGEHISCEPDSHFIEILPNLDLWRKLK